MTMMMVVVVWVLLNDQNWKWQLYIWHLQGTISARVKISAQPDFYWGSLSSAPTQRGQVMLARVGSGISTKPRKTKVGRHKTRLWLLGDYDDDGDALYQTMKLGRQSMCLLSHCEYDCDGIVVHTERQHLREAICYMQASTWLTVHWKTNLFPIRMKKVKLIWDAVLTSAMDSRVQFHTRLKQASCMSCEDFPAKNKLSKYVAFRRVKGQLRPSTTQPTKLHFSHKGNTCSSGFQICWHIVLWNILSIFCQCNRQGLQKMKRQQHMLVAKIFQNDAHIALHTSTAEKNIMNS